MSTAPDTGAILEQHPIVSSWPTDPVENGRSSSTAEDEATMCELLAAFDDFARFLQEVAQQRGLV